MHAGLFWSENGYVIMEKSKRQIGSVVGLAIGDAIGAPWEFTRGPNVVNGYESGGPWDLEKGQWTDDTSMALCLADSIIESGWSLRDQLDRYVRWHRDGYMSSTGSCFDIGVTTCRSLSAYQKTGFTIAPHDDRSRGNGSIMRLAPAAVYASRIFDVCGMRGALAFANLCGTSSLTTHSHRECVDCCAFLGLVLGFLYESMSLEECFKQDAWHAIQMLESFPEIGYEVFESSKKPVPFGVRGRAIDTLIAAIHCVATTSTFCEAVCKAAALGGDTDSVGAVAGQIAGALYGIDGIDHDLIGGLFWSDKITAMATELSEWVEKPRKK
jgi:ADP-ribosyl-[dinitrogen reductase] hydrolase